jgi:hypothetical protein
MVTPPHTPIPPKNLGGRKTRGELDKLEILHIKVFWKGDEAE